MPDKMPIKQVWSQRLAAIEDLKFSSLEAVKQSWPAQADWIDKNKNITGSEALDLMDAALGSEPPLVPSAF